MFYVDKILSFSIQQNLSSQRYLFQINDTLYGFKDIIRSAIGGANDGRVAMLFQVCAFTISILVTVGNHEIRSWVCF